MQHIVYGGQEVLVRYVVTWPCQLPHQVAVYGGYEVLMTYVVIWPCQLLHQVAVYGGYKVLMRYAVIWPCQLLYHVAVYGGHQVLVRSAVTWPCQLPHHAIVYGGQEVLVRYVVTWPSGRFFYLKNILDSLLILQASILFFLLLPVVGLPPDFMAISSAVVAKKRNTNASFSFVRTKSKENPSEDVKPVYVSVTYSSLLSILFCFLRFQVPVVKRGPKILSEKFHKWIIPKF